MVEEHSQRRRREGDKFVAADMVDLLLELADDPKLEVPIKRDGVKGFALVRMPWSRGGLLINILIIHPFHILSERFNYKISN